MRGQTADSHFKEGGLARPWQLTLAPALADLGLLGQPAQSELQGSSQPADDDEIVDSLPKDQAAWCRWFKDLVAPAPFPIVSTLC